MKKIINIAALLFLGTVSAQVAVNKTSITNSSVLLEFYSDTSNKLGIVLPSVATVPATPAEGTFIADSNSNSKKVKVYQNGAWLDLTQAGNIPAPSSTTDAAGSGVIIGASSSAVDGALVLESADKALVLPSVTDPHLNMPSPDAGTICFDPTTQCLVVFDGVKWNFWN